jgi:hypothetical protein
LKYMVYRLERVERRTKFWPAVVHVLAPAIPVPRQPAQAQLPSLLGRLDRIAIAHQGHGAVRVQLEGSDDHRGREQGLHEGLAAHFYCGR